MSGLACFPYFAWCKQDLDWYTCHRQPRSEHIYQTTYRALSIDIHPGYYSSIWTIILVPSLFQRDRATGVAAALIVTDGTRILRTSRFHVEGPRPNRTIYRNCPYHTSLQEEHAVLSQFLTENSISRAKKCAPLINIFVHAHLSVSVWVYTYTVTSSNTTSPYHYDRLFELKITWRYDNYGLEIKLYQGSYFNRRWYHHRK